MKYKDLNFDQDINDDGKLYNKYLNKCNNAKKENLTCLLTYNDFCVKVREANLKSSDLGYSGKKYVLARYKDLGNYRPDNCKFILQKENAAERKISFKSRLASRNNIIKCNKNRPSNFYEERLKSKGWKKYCERRQHEKELHKQQKDALKDKRYCGEHNGSYGTHWITNGIDNKKWKDEYEPLPEGYHYGRIV